MSKTPKQKPAAGGVQSVEIGIRVLNAVMEAGGPSGLSTIAHAAGLPPAKAHRYLVSLIRSGMAEQDPATGKYDLGSGALRIGMAAITGLNVVRSAIPVMTDLRERAGYTVVLTVWGEHGPTVVHWEEALTPIVVNLRIGSVMPLLSTATGYVYVAYLPRPQTRKMLNEELKRWAGAAGIDVDTIVREVRTVGMASLNMADARSLAAIAAPIFAHDGKLAAVVTQFGFLGSYDNSLTGPNAPGIRQAAEEISTRIGYDPDRKT